MTISTEQLAELLAGIVRSQQAIIDAIESESGGWRNTHLLPKLNTAANMRLAKARLLDIPSRVLLRSQGRVPMDAATIARDLHEAMGTTPSGVTAAVGPAVVGAAAGAGVAAVAAVAATTASAAPAADDDLDFFAS
jgi:hypothetical protein